MLGMLLTMLTNLEYYTLWCNKVKNLDSYNLNSQIKDDFDTEAH